MAKQKKLEKATVKAEKKMEQSVRVDAPSSLSMLASQRKPEQRKPAVRKLIAGLKVEESRKASLLKILEAANSAKELAALETAAREIERVEKLRKA